MKLSCKGSWTAYLIRDPVMNWVPMSNVSFEQLNPPLAIFSIV